MGQSYSMKLTGITNDEFDPSVDTFNSTISNLLEFFGVDALKMTIKKRGFRPQGIIFIVDKYFRRRRGLGDISDNHRAESLSFKS